MIPAKFAVKRAKSISSMIKIFTVLKFEKLEKLPCVSRRVLISE
jgi:hypothetical protein